MGWDGGGYENTVYGLHHQSIQFTRSEVGLRFAFLISSQVMLMLLVWGPQFKSLVHLFYLTGEDAGVHKVQATLPESHSE